MDRAVVDPLHRKREWLTVERSGATIAREATRRAKRFLARLASPPARRARKWRRGHSPARNPASLWVTDTEQPSPSEYRPWHRSARERQPESGKCQTSAFLWRPSSAAR